MARLTLDIQALRVESFEPLPAGAGGRGTVHGHAACPTHDCSLQGGCSKDAVTCNGSCDPCATCDTSCAGGPYCDCVPSGCVSCLTSCAGGPFCDCPPTPACPLPTPACPEG